MRDISIRLFGEDRVFYQHLVQGENQDSARLFLYGKELISDLVKLGITQKKSETLAIDFSLLDPLYFHHFLRGYFDGDGNLTYYHDKNIRLRIDGNLYMMKCIQDNIYRIYNINTSVYQVNSPVSFDFYRWVLYRNNLVLELLNIMYGEATLYLERKFNPISHLIN